MRGLPSGTVTLVFTDIEGSTRLVHELGDEYADVLAEHRRLLREVFNRRHGVEVDTQGDAFLWAFARASDAATAAQEAHDALRDGRSGFGSGSTAASRSSRTRGTSGSPFIARRA